MGDTPLKIKQLGKSVLLTINRPDALNALNAGVFQAFYDFFSTGFEAHLPFHSVVITGSGEKAFAAGADIKEFSTMDAAQGAQLSRKGHETFFLIERFHKPVIAAVNGFALGGGCELAMACHLRIASRNARFGQPEVNLGLTPGYGGTQRLTQLIGKGRAMELLLTGDMIDAEKALDYGLVNAIYEPEELLPACETLGDKLAGKGPLALAKVIDCINAYNDPGIDGFEYEIRQFASLMDSQDFSEGTNAFIEKRKPAFTGS